jgi:hypothetical protein
LTRSGTYSAADRDRRLEAEVRRLEHDAGDLLRYTEGVQARDRFNDWLPGLYGRGLEDQLLAKLVDRPSARQHGVAGNAEVGQDLLDGAKVVGHVTEFAC